MSVEAVIAALAGIEAEIQITTPLTTAFAFASPPNSISGNLPCFVNLFGESVVDMNLGGKDEYGIDVLDTCNYVATLYVAGAGTGTPGESFDKITPWITPAAKVFLAHPNVELESGIVLMRYLGHGRARGDLVYGGQQYYGVEFRLQVMSRMRASYASYE